MVWANSSGRPLTIKNGRWAPRTSQKESGRQVLMNKRRADGREFFMDDQDSGGLDTTGVNGAGGSLKTAR